MKWNLKQIADWTGAEILAAHEYNFDAIGTDTRADLTGKIFVALKGDQYDAHDYLDKAVASGATALLVHEFDEKFSRLKDKVSILKVEDTLVALQEFAQGFRKTLKTQIIGITGSNGKTTTKEFTAQIISPYKKTHYSHGSFNNHWGVPLTLLGIPTGTDIAVVEMGMNHAGEIKRLVEIADPDVVVCTMVGTAHLEFFGTQGKIAQAKSEIYNFSKEETVRVFNQDQELTFDMMYPVAKKYPHSRMLSFSAKNDKTDVYFKIEEITMRSLKISGIIAGKNGEAVIPIFGKQNLTNLMAAATLAYACGISPDQIWKSLPNCKTAWGRNQFIETEGGAEILFDGYNANPDSMKALIENIPLLKTSGKKIAVFGQMKELGAEAKKAHEELGALASNAGFSHIFFIGEDHLHFADGLKNFKGKKFVAKSFDKKLGEQLHSLLSKGDLVIIKGSRGAETERFIEFCEPLNWSKKK